MKNRKRIIGSFVKNIEEKFDNKRIPIVENVPRVDIIKSPDGKTLLMRFGQVVLTMEHTDENG